ncbi:hypothetical protein GA0115234_100666 [Streptomyces sp. DvalAA-43]|nr:hypothetical protein GA0115234_100666 [Streptomyces sp. DvalAA-43]
MPMVVAVLQGYMRHRHSLHLVVWGHGCASGDAWICPCLP